MLGNMNYQYGIILYLIVFFLTAIIMEFFKRTFMCKEAAVLKPWKAVLWKRVYNSNKSVKSKSAVRQPILKEITSEANYERVGNISPHRN